jgi:hypothetical protein
LSDTDYTPDGPQIAVNCIELLFILYLNRQTTIGPNAITIERQFRNPAVFMLRNGVRYIAYEVDPPGRRSGRSR